MKIGHSQEVNLNIRTKSGFQRYAILVLMPMLILLFFLAGDLMYQNGVHDTVKYFMQGRFDDLPDGAIKETITEFSSVIKSETNAYSSNGLSNLYIDIPFENVQVLQQKRIQALETGILLASDDDYVSASVRYNDSAPMEVELRLKGDWIDHLKGDKWSYRIHMKDDGAIEGMTRLSIQAPETRNFLYEWAYHQNLMKEGVLAPRYYFVNVIENGENKGIYALEESFYTELMESQERRSGIIIRYNEDDMWQNWATFFSTGKEDLLISSGSSGYFMDAGFDSATVSGYGLGKILDDPVLLPEYRTAQELLRNYQTGQMNASEVFDMEKMGKFLAISELWGAGHAIAWHNLRFYYNPVTNLLEPIGFDGIPMVSPYDSTNLYETFSSHLLFRDNEIANSFYWSAQELFSADYISGIKEDLDSEGYQLCDAISVEYDSANCLDWEKLNDRVELLNNNLTVDIPVEGLAKIINKNKLEIDFTNEYFYALSIIDISIGDINLLTSSKGEKTIPNGGSENPGISSLTIDLSNELVSRITGEDIILNLAVNGDTKNVFQLHVKMENQ